MSCVNPEHVYSAKVGWRSAGETRIGIFTRRAIKAGEELTYDYHFQHSGLVTAAQGFRCLCGAPNCRGTMDANPERMKDAGRRVRIHWDTDGKWYEGRVCHYSPSTDKHTVFYPGCDVAPGEGTKESVVLADIPHEWLDEPWPAPEAATLKVDSTRPPRPASPRPGTPPALQPGRRAAAACCARLNAPWPGETVSAVGAAGDPRGVADLFPQRPPVAAESERVPLPAPLPLPLHSAASAQALEGLRLLSDIAASIPDARLPVSITGAQP
jgi:hypothetical protein